MNTFFFSGFFSLCLGLLFTQILRYYVLLRSWNQKISERSGCLGLQRQICSVAYCSVVEVYFTPYLGT